MDNEENLRWSFQIQIPKTNIFHTRYKFTNNYYLSNKKKRNQRKGEINERNKIFSLNRLLLIIN